MQAEHVKHVRSSSFCRQFAVYLQFNEFRVGYRSFWLSSGNWIFFFILSLITSVTIFWVAHLKNPEVLQLGKEFAAYLKTNEFLVSFSSFWLSIKKRILKRNFSFSSYLITLQAEHVKHVKISSFCLEFDVYLQFNEFGVGYRSFWLSSGNWIFFFILSLITSVTTFWVALLKNPEVLQLG